MKDLKCTKRSVALENNWLIKVTDIIKPDVLSLLLLANMELVKMLYAYYNEILTEKSLRACAYIQQKYAFHLLPCSQNLSYRSMLERKGSFHVVLINSLVVILLHT